MSAVAEHVRVPVAPLPSGDALSAAIRETGFRRWYNDLRIMRGIDKHELVVAGVIGEDDEVWGRFCDDPYTFAVYLGDAQAVALYRLIDGRRPAAMRDEAACGLAST